MAETQFDFAVLGSTPLAALIAGLLATTHKRRVCYLGDAPSPVRLPRGFDLSVGPITRPETWALLRRTTPETLKVLARAGAKQAYRRLDPVLAADTAAGSEALAHMRHVASGFGYAVEPVSKREAPFALTACRIRDAALLLQPQLDTALSAWLTRAKIRRIPTAGVSVHLTRDGGARIESTGGTVEAAHAVLADDAAILAYLDREERSAVFRVTSATTILTEPARPLMAEIMVFADRGVLLVQRPSGAIAAMAQGRVDEASEKIGACLAGQGRLRRAGQAIFKSLSLADGAPFIGPSRSTRATIIAGLGLVGAFLAPSIARGLADKSRDDELAFFAARRAPRPAERSSAAEFHMVEPVP